MYQYIKRDSFIHALNPMLKFVGIAILTAVLLLFLTVRPILIILTFTLFLLLVGARLPLRTVWRGLSPFLLVGFGFAWVNVLFSDVGGDVLWRWGILDITTGSIETGISLGLRIMTIVALGLLFSATTEPRALVISMVEQARLPYKVAFGMYIALRFLPMMSEEMETLRAVQQVRQHGGGKVGRIRAFRSLLIPLFLSVIRKSIALGIAMESKAFGAYEKRTYLAKSAVTWRDPVFITTVLVFVTTVIVIINGKW